MHAQLKEGHGEQRASFVPAIEAPTVYVLESEVKAGESISWILGSAGFRVESYARGGDFLRSLRSDARGCVLVNLRLSDVDCVAVLEELSLRKIAMPVVLYGGKGGMLSIVQPFPTGTTGREDGESFGMMVLDRINRAMEICEANRAKRTHMQQAREQLRLLTRRELEIAQLMVAGKPNKKIADELGISDRTVEIHRSRVMRKTDSDSLADLVWLFGAAGMSRSATIWPSAELQRFVRRGAPSAI